MNQILSQNRLEQKHFSHKQKTPKHHRLEKRRGIRSYDVLAKHPKQLHGDFPLLRFTDSSFHRERRGRIDETIPEKLLNADSKYFVDSKLDKISQLQHGFYFQTGKKLTLMYF